MDDPTTVTLRPSRATAGGWTAVGAVATGLAVWVALDAADSLVAWVFAALCLVVTLYVALQLVAPRWFTVALDAEGVEVRLPWQREHVPWDRVHQARVVRVAGEPMLELHVDAADDHARGRGLGVVLPVGSDQDALHRVLEQRLGRQPVEPDGSSTRTT